MRRPRASEHTEAELRRGLRAFLVVLSISVLSVAIPAYLVADVPDSPRSDAWMLTLVVLVWAGVRLSLLWVAGIPRLFDFFLWLFAYIFMGLAPTAQIKSGLTSTTTPGIDPSLDVPTAGIVLLGLACYEIARLIWIARERRHPHAARAPRAVSGWRTLILGVLAAALSLYVLSRLGVTVLLGSREASTAARAAIWPDPAIRVVVYASAVYPLLVAVGALSQLRRSPRSLRSRRLITVAAVAGGALLVLIVNPVTSARYTFGTVAFALLVYLGAVSQRRWARLTMVGTLMGFLFVFPLADAFRRIGGGPATRTGFFDEYLSNPDYDAFWQIANALAYWLEGLVVPLSQFAGSVLFWVPRAVWPTKPDDTGVMLAAYRGYSFDNLSAPVWAEALVNGGVIAVIVVFVVLGVVLRMLDTRVLPAFDRGGVWAIAGAILPVFMTILLRGSLLQATGPLVITIACIAWVCGPRAAPDSRTEAALVVAEPVDRAPKPLGERDG